MNQLAHSTGHVFCSKLRAFLFSGSMTWLPVLVVLIFNPVPVMADGYTIQVGVYKNLSKETLDSAEQLGNVYREAVGPLTRVTVGRYDTRAEAEVELSRIQSGGFDDAFVRSTGTSAKGDSAQKIIDHHGEHSHGGVKHTHLPEAMEKVLSALPESERENVVILDGKLHRKEGDTFTPL